MSFSITQILQRVFTAVEPISGHLKVSPFGSFNPPATADAVTYEEPTTSSEAYKYRTGGAAGTVVMTLTLTYEDDTKAKLVSVVKS